MNLKIILPILGLLTIAGAGCATSNSSVPTTSQPSAMAEHGAAMTSTPPSSGHATMDHVSKLAGSRIDLEKRTSFKPGAVTFRFALYGLDGHEFGADDLKIAHEKKMHFLLVRDDMTQFQHIHPEFKNNNWEVTTTIPEAGDYQIYVDIEPIEESPVVLRVPVTIGGPTATKNTPAPSVGQSALNGMYKAQLQVSGTLKTNEQTTLTFALTKNNQPVSDIGPYLGAYGHVVLLRHNDADDFFHVHPITESKPIDGKVTFAAQFPVKGRYTLYAQFNLGGQVKTFPITVDVTEEGTPTAASSSPSDVSNMHHGG